MVKDNIGYRYRSTIYNLEKSTNKFNRFSAKNEFTVQNMLHYMEETGIHLEMVDKTPRKINVAKDKIGWYCEKCGAMFNTTWEQVSRINHKRLTPKHRCDMCSGSQSNLEYIVEKYIIQKDMKYIKQYRIDSCRNIRSIPFDFYFPEYNTVCEINGSQHYYESALFSQTLKERQKIDKIKMDYCKNNNIRFVAIPFWNIVNNNKVKSYKLTIDNILNQN